MHSITAGLLLTKLNTGSEYFTYSELRDCDDDSPFDARREINALLKEGFIREDGDRRYRITVDIYTLRKFVLKGDSDVKGPSETSMTYRFDSFKIVESVWHAANRVTETDRFDNKSDDEDEEEDRYELNRRRREYLEKRRQELIARLREELCESDDDDDDDADEEEINRRRREYLERRRRELIARMQEEMAENDDDDDDDRILINDDDDDDDDNDLLGDDDDDEDEEEDDEDDDDNPFEDDKYSMTAHSLFAKSEEEEMLEKIRNLLIGGDRNSKLAVAALKLCASEGYVSPWLLCKTQHADDSTAEFICFWLYVNDFIKRDENDENKYLLAIPENLFFACCNEAEERRKSLGHLAVTLKKISEQKQKKEHEERDSLQKYANNYQFRKVVRAKLIALVRTDLKMTRAKAITKAEGCLCAARDMGNDKAAAVYEKVIFELNNMSDYLYTRLKSQQTD